MILVDTSVIADILTRDAEWFEWSSGQIERWADEGPVCYDTIVFSELAVKFDTQKELEHRLSAFAYLPLPLNAAFQAGKPPRNTVAPVEERRDVCRTFSLAPTLTWLIYPCSHAIRAGCGVSFPPCGLSRREVQHTEIPGDHLSE